MKKMHKGFWLFSLLLIIFLLNSGCSKISTIFSKSTETPTATATLTITPTPRPTNTATQTPTPTTTPTPTMTPTNCPVEKIKFDYPKNGQTLDFDGGYLFRVDPISCANGYLWGFFQDDVLIWENLRDEGTLSSNDYGIWEDNPGHAVFKPGYVRVSVRYLFPNGEWSDAKEISIFLQP